MAKTLGILTLHGMGKQGTGYFKKLARRISRELGVAAWGKIHLESIYYHGQMQQNQGLMWDRMNVGRDLDSTWFRKKMLYSFSDAANIQNYTSDQSMGRYATHQIRQGVNSLNEELARDDTPIIAIGQSLGNQVLSNYLWDAQNGNGIFSESPASEAEKLVQLRMWFSTGNNMPLFVSGLDEEDIEPIQKPNDSLEWFNYYDRDDALGWPLRPVCSKYRDELDVQDYEIQTGFTTFDSHVDYWTDGDFIDPLCEKIRGII